MARRTKAEMAEARQRARLQGDLESALWILGDTSKARVEDVNWAERVAKDAHSEGMYVPECYWEV